jgi:predicted cupin superfamily sugar epimerase
MSSCDPGLNERLRPAFPVGSGQESEKTKAIIRSLNLQVHPEGGYFNETDRYQLRVPTPFESKRKEEGEDSVRDASTTIFYMITPKT